MRYHEFRLVEQKLFESNRGILGTVIDTQAGRGASFTSADGNEVKAVNAWKFPVEDTVKRYEGSTVSPAYIKTLQVQFNNAQELSPQLQTEIDNIVNSNTVTNLKQIANSNIAYLSDAAAEFLQSQNQTLDIVSMDEKFAAELKEATGLDINTVKWVSGQKPSTGFAALVVELQTEKGREWVGKYFSAKQASGHIFWQVSQFIKDLKNVGIDLEEKKAAGSKKQDTRVNFGPKNVGIADRVINLNNLVQEVQTGVQQNIAAEDQTALVELLENLGGATTTINPEYASNYEVQYGEVAAPLALARGINITGSIQAAEAQLLDYLDPGTKFTSINQVEYPENIAEKLIDSYLITPNGSKVGVSSKDKGGGAAASITSIIETINNKLDKIKERVPDFEERYAEYISRLRVIENSTGKTVAFNLAADMGIISEEVAKQALDVMLTTPGDVDALKAIDGGKYYDMTINYSGYEPKFEHPMYRVSYHATTSLARIAAAKFNEDKEQTYRFFATVLESSNMIQVMTTLKVKGDQGEFSKFDVVYPPVFDGDIKLDPSSYFTAQRPPAGYTFKIK